MIKLILLTGFLGAGKTTLMKSILDTYKDYKVGVIVNEFGSVNIDAILIKRNGIEMAELSNGSIFCACIKDKFVDSLIEMSKMDLEYLFIEASGLADPANMPQILRGISAKTGDAYGYKGAICVVDGENFLDLFDLLPAVKSQLEFSSTVIINKADLVLESELIKSMELISETNSQAEAYVTSFCRIDIRKVVDNLKIINIEERDTLNTLESKPKTIILRAENPVPYEKLENFLKDIVENTYRIKGFVNTDRGAIEVSTVGNNISLNKWNEHVNNTEIVVISSVGIKIISVISEAIENHVKDIISF